MLFNGYEFKLSTSDIALIIYDLHQMHNAGCTVIFKNEFATLEETQKVKEVTKVLSAIEVGTSRSRTQNSDNWEINDTCYKNRPLHVLWLAKTFRKLKKKLSNSRHKVS